MAFDKDLYSKTRHTEWNITGDRYGSSIRHHTSSWNCCLRHFYSSSGTTTS